MADHNKAPELKCALNVIRAFGTTDIGREGLSGSWTDPEVEHHWSGGLAVSLTVVTESAVRSRTRISIGGSPFIVPGLCPKQDVQLFGDGLLLGAWRLTEPRDYLLVTDLDPEQWRKRNDKSIIKLTWLLPDSTVAARVAKGTDIRELGFCFREFSVKTIDRVE